MGEFRCIVCGAKISEDDFKQQNRKCEICMIRSNPFFQIIISIIISGIITYLMSKDGTYNQGDSFKIEQLQNFLLWFDVSIGWHFLSGFGISIIILFDQENNNDDSLMFLKLIIFTLLVTLKTFASCFVGIIALPANIVRIILMIRHKT